MLEAGVVFSRFLHYAAVLILFGISLFPLYTYSGRAGGQPAPVTRRLRLAVSSVTFAALLSGGFLFACVAANMAGTPSGGLRLGKPLCGVGGSRFWEMSIAPLPFLVVLFPPPLP